MKDKTAIAGTIEDLTHTLRYLLQTGWRGFDCSSEALEKLNNWDTQAADRSETLQDIRLVLGD
jgi:hypothetical protein